jgi:hypothetical protein
MARVPNASIHFPIYLRYELPGNCERRAFRRSLFDELLSFSGPRRA